MNNTPADLPTDFYAKVWYHYVLAIVFTSFTVFCAILGPLFLFDMLRPADGKPGTDAGIAMSIIALPMGLLAMLGWFNVYSRRRPLLRIYREGIEINVIGASSLDRVPLIPPLARVAWAIVSLQGFKKQVGWIPWSTLRIVQVTGLPMVRVMVIEATIAYPTFRHGERGARIGECVAFSEAVFRDPLDVIASTILSCHNDLETRNRLPSLRDYQKSRG